MGKPIDLEPWVHGFSLNYSGSNLRDVRLMSGLKAKHLAELLDITREHVSRVERGHKPVTRVLSLAWQAVCQGSGDRRAMATLKERELTAGAAKA